MDDSKIEFIQCLGCGKRIPYGDYINHTHTCQNRESKEFVILPDPFKQWMQSSPPLPIRNPDCECDICKGVKICPNPLDHIIEEKYGDKKEKRMYLDRERKVWLCKKCNHYQLANVPANHKPIDSEPKE